MNAARGSERPQWPPLLQEQASYRKMTAPGEFVFHEPVRSERDEEGYQEVEKGHGEEKTDFVSTGKGEKNRGQLTQDASSSGCHQCRCRTVRGGTPS